MIQTELNAKLRTNRGRKSLARNLRIEGFVPAICYGAISEPVPIYVSAKDLKTALSTEAKTHVLINMKLDKSSELNGRIVLLKDIDKHPLKKSYIHADFLVLDMEKPIVVTADVNLVGRPVGVKMGGILDQVRRLIKIECLPKDIPERIDVDITDLDVGDSLHVSDMNVPEGIKIVSSGKLTIAVVASPGGATDEEGTEEATEEATEEEATV